MRSFNITVDEKFFNLLWRSLSERENELEVNIENTDSENAALIGNDLVYLRMCKKEIEEKAKKEKFSEGVFSLEDGYIDLSEL